MKDTLAQPLYIAIQQAMEGAIMSGTWPPGHRVPSEHELMEQYACSRMTVNKALSNLANTGLIVRRRRSGTMVAFPSAEEAVLEIHHVRDEVVQKGKAYRYELLRREIHRADDVEATRLGVKVGEKVLAILARHFSDGRPYVLEDRLINLSVVPDAADLGFTEISPGSWLLDRIPWQEAQHQIYAVNARGDTRKWLRVADRFACLVLARTTWYAKEIVTYATLTYPADQHVLVGRFSPAKHGADAAPKKAAGAQRKRVAKKVG